MAASPLYLHQRGRLVATLDLEGLRYASSWLEDPNHFPLSQTLPLRQEPFARAKAWRWLVNLLPEGESRRRIAARLQISQDNDLALLTALGSDCAGAISISQELPQETLPRNAAQYRRIEPEELQELAQRPGAAAALITKEVRLSLAGAQDKIPIRQCADGSMWLPLHQAPSTHLLKCPNPAFAHLVLNEFFCLELARAVGLSVAKAELQRSAEGTALLVIERFDRETVPPSPAPSPEAKTAELPWIERLHQEDFAQALGHAHYEKYQSEGGPSFADCIALLRGSAQRPVQEMIPALRWLIFCLIIGNRDNHAKNLARVYRQGYWKLAPFYDLVCTRAYKGLAPSLAMRIGEEGEVNRLNEERWICEAKRCRLGTRMVLREIQHMCDRVHEELIPLSEDLLQRQGFDPSALAPVLQAIRKGLRATQRSID